MIESLVMVNDDKSCDDEKHNNIKIVINIGLQNHRLLNVFLDIIHKDNTECKSYSLFTRCDAPQGNIRHGSNWTESDVFFLSEKGE